MNLKSKLVTAAGLGVAGTVLTAGVAMAAPAPLPHPHTYTAVTHLINRGDSGDAGNYWANDTMLRTVKFTQVPDGITGQWEYKVTVVDQGTFKTNTNELSPHSTAFPGVKTGHLPHAGTIYGGGSYTVTSNSPLSNKRNLGVPFSEYGTPVAGSNETTGNWPVLAFPSSAHVTNSGINPWGWTYRANVLTGFHKVTTWNKVFTGFKWEFVPVWHNGHKSLKWEKVAQFKYVPHATEKPTYQHEQYVDASAGETGNIAGL